MSRIPNKFTAIFMSLVMLAVAVICPRALGAFAGQGQAVAACCGHVPGTPASKGDSTCDTFCSTRVLDHAKASTVDFSPVHLVALINVMPVMGVVQASVVRGDGWEVGVPREAARSLFQLHCALLV